MRAAIVTSLEGPDAVHVVDDFAEPPATHERANGARLLIEVRAAGLSVIDLLQSRGLYQYGTAPPYATGSEIAGVVLEADDATGFAPGDRVGSIVFWGGAAQRCVAAPDYTVRLPESMSFEQGASVYLNYSTAWYAYHRARVEAGQTVLVHGAAGGVGSAVCDLAEAFGAKVIAVVSSDEKEAVARASGAWEVVRSDGDWLGRVKQLTDGRGVDVVLDPVGGDRFTDSLRALRTGGVLVVIGFVGGDIPQLKVNRLLLRNLTVTGISMDTMDKEHPGTLRFVADNVERLMAEGRIHPHIDSVFDLEHTADALRRLDSGATTGKVVVRVS